MYPRGDESHETKWPRGRIQTETYGFACQKTRCWSLNLILISCMSLRGDFRPERASERVTRITPVICTPWQAALYPIGRCRATHSINLRQVDPTRRRLFDRRHETPSMRPPMPVPIPSASLLIPNLINRCAIHNDTLAYRCTPLSRMHKYSLEMVLPCLPMDNGVQRFPPSWLEMRALRGGHRDQACLHNFRIRDAEHVGGLFFEQEMQGALST